MRRLAPGMGPSTNYKRCPLLQLSADSSRLDLVLASCRIGHGLTPPTASAVSETYEALDGERPVVPV